MAKQKRSRIKTKNSVTLTSTNYTSIHFLDYLDSSEFDLQNVCRICLFVKEELESLNVFAGQETFGFSNDTLGKLLQAILSVEVLNDDSMPNQICVGCREDLVNSYQFKEKCENSENTLKSVLKGEYVKDEPSLSRGTSPVSSQNDTERTLSDITTVIEIVKYKDELSSKDTFHMETGEDQDVNMKIEEDSIYPATTVLNKNLKKRISTINGSVEHNLVNKRKKNKKKSKVDFIETDYENVNYPKSSKRLICNLCTEDFPCKPSLRAHVTSSHPTARACAAPRCARSFLSSADLERHAQLHTGALRCRDCGKEFTLRSRFARHLERHMEHKRHPCAACPAAFSERAALRRHRRRHTGQAAERRHACTHCDKRFVELSALRAHLLRHSGARPCVCPSCGAGFRTPRLLTSHARTHSAARPYPCQYCDKRFRHSSTRTAHQRLHTGERPYVCARCGRSFRQHSNLTLHARTHSGERPYSCNICDRKFSTGSALKNHQKTHAGDKASCCPTCGQKMTANGLRTHVCQKKLSTPAATQPQDTENKKHSCSSCPKKFTSKSLLAKHSKTHQVTPLEPRVIFVNQPFLIVHRLTDAPYCAEEVVIPAERGATGSGPLEGVCVESRPLDGVCVESGPLEGVCAESVPLDSVCVESGPLDGVFVESGPLDGVCVESVPQDSECVESGTLDVESGPLDGLCVESGPLDGVCVVSGPLDGVCVERGPLDGVCVEGGPLDSVCVDSVPMSGVENVFVESEPVQNGVIENM